MDRTAPDDLVGVVRAMACDITVRGVSSADDSRIRSSIDSALSVFRAVDAACTRFDPASPLMRANARSDQCHQVPELLYRAIEEAHRAYLRTHGQFDPRVLGDLVRLGYDRSLPFADGGVVTPRSPDRRQQLGRWCPRFRGGPTAEVNLGGVPIDLGGIGKGLAVRWATERLAGHVHAYQIDAGGDCACGGPGPDGDGWRVGVEDPCGGTLPLAVLELRDVACATSSIRLRQWTSGQQQVHHLIDPHSGRPGGRGLLAVTVVADDPAEAEVFSKTLFLQGPRGIGAEARRRNAAALWIDVDGVKGESPRLTPHVVWSQAP